MTPVLSGPARQEIVESAALEPRLPAAMSRLGEAIGSDIFNTSTGTIRLAKLMRHFDALTRAEGFHALHDWDGVSDRVNPDTISMDVLRYVAGIRKNDATDRRVLAILLDYYFLHVLSLLSLRVWDDGDANANLDRVADLLEHLQGPQGSGHRFASDAETLLLIATCHYEREERGYELLLDRVGTLNRRHQLQVSLGHAASMGCHLRFGFETTYAKSPDLMRDDNVADYPWLRYALITLLEAFNDGASEPLRTTIIEALVGGLSADAALFMSEPAFLSTFRLHRSELVAGFERHRPSDEAYSPLSFFFNFSRNVLKGAVVDAMLWGEPWPVSLNDLLTSLPDATADAAPLAKREALARTLMDYARKNPHRIRGKLTPVIVYDPETGRRAFAAAMRAIEGGR